MKLIRVVVLLLVATPALAERWEMRSNFWVSLHHTLLDAAQNSKTTEETLTAQERTAWINAVLAYRSRFTDRVPWENEELTRINDTLSSTGEMLQEGLQEDVARALLQAAPIYRKLYWPADDRANRFWISSAEGLLRDAGEELANAHGRVYGVTYPPKIRVDVSPYAGALGAYTTDANGFIHTTISSRDPNYQGFAALEMLLHEGSHGVVGPTTGAIATQINTLATERRILIPRQLWHGILFYTSGELTRRVLRERGVADYMPYAYKKGMYDRAFTGLRQPLETFWQSYLDGRMARDASVQAIVEATSTAVPQRAPDR